MSSNVSVNLPHHMKEELCTNRPAYRQGRKFTSVKVYTVNKESQHLLIYNVPAINLDAELHKLCQRFGTVTACKRVPTQDVEDFTNVYHVCFEKIYHARFAKRKMDNLSFYGGILHVCYAPELETIEETRGKLSTRRKEVAFHLKKLEFPKQFSQRGMKRKFQDKINDKTFSFNNFNNSISSQVSDPQEPITSLPGSSGIKQVKTPVIDVKPFKKLIPTKVSRIIFHKTEHINKP